jgi:feruloyl esterase
MRITRIVVATLLAVVAAGAMTDRSATAAGSCESLAALAIPDATITFAAAVEAGPFSPGAPAAPAAQGGGAAMKVPRASCRVAATLRPSPDSEIKIEVWLPAANWNGKFQAVGNGAFNGSISYPAMMTALGRGYATASTDTGHTGNTASFGLGHPEKVVDFGWRAVHEMTVVSKKIIAAYYDGAPKFSYWNGCSAGGRQGLKAAQRFPADFDGIIAGAPGHDWTGRASQAVLVAQALQKDPAVRLTPAKTRLVHDAALAACDARDGVKDGVIDSPDACPFDPAVLQCKAGDAETCLTPPQVNTVRMLYAPQVNASTRREVSGLLPGSELGWTDLGWTASARASGLEQFRFLVFKDPAWDIGRFNAATDIARAESADDNTINALDPDLRPFIARNGKLIQYHGWADPQISPGASVQYYKSVLAALGEAGRVHGSYRLFMAPGMGHCSGGAGPNTFDMVTALEQWVEQGRAPDHIVASRVNQGAVDRTRPLCPYPQVASYKGSGSTDEAANFACLAR